MTKKLTSPTPRRREKRPKSSPPQRESSRDTASADRAWREYARRRNAQPKHPFGRALAWGTVVAVVAGVLTGVLRTWVWILALEAVALGVIIGESAAVPSSVRQRRPPGWSYAYVFGVGCAAYVLVHISFWLASEGFAPTRSLPDFLRAAPSATAAPIFHSVDLARQVALATGGATALKYWLWVGEGLLMGMAAALAYRGGSIRKLKT